SGRRGGKPRAGSTQDPRMTARADPGPFLRLGRSDGPYAGPVKTPDPGKRVTISDIAAKAGVSIGAVSFALNARKGVSEKTRARVLKVADELGWAPTSAARTLAGGGTETVGLVLARDPHNLGVESFYMQ